MIGKQMFPCPVCTGPREVLTTKKNKPYLTCDPCGVQVFIRGPGGIKEFSRLLHSTSEEALLARLTRMEQHYRLTCPDCGQKFWISPRLIKTSMFDGSVKDFRCPELGCGGVATWGDLWWEVGKRRSRLIGTLKEFRTKGAAWDAAMSSTLPIGGPSEGAKQHERETPTVRTIAARYEQERLPSRHSTARMYRSWLRNHILPKWGDVTVTEVQPRPVELWLRELKLSPKSKSHVRGMLRLLMEFAMWSGVLEISRNPIDLVVVKGATKRTRQPRSLTVDEFQKFIQHLEEPFRTMALLCVCFGLRISECLALKWCDVDWLNGKLRIERAIVRQCVDDVKTIYSQKQMSIDPELLVILKAWKQNSQFSADGDWLFASPVQPGRLPWSYPCVLGLFHKAANTAGVGSLPTHTYATAIVRGWMPSELPSLCSKN